MRISCMQLVFSAPRGADMYKGMCKAAGPKPAACNRCRSPLLDTHLYQVQGDALTNTAFKIL